VAEALGQAVLTLAVDDRQYKAGLDQSKRLAEQTGAQINRSLQVKGGGLFGDVGAELGALKGGLASGALAAAGVAVAVGAIGFAVVQAAGDAQKLTAAFTGLTGSASAAAALRQELFTLSKTTPFKNDELLGAAQRFLAVGVEAENLGGTINRIGALAAQSGQSLDRVGLIYAQVFAKGRLQGEENLQFLEAGIDLNSQLAKVTGLSGQALQDAMSKGKISLNDVNQAIVLATGSMTALEGAGQSVSVKFANIGDNVQQVFLGFAQAITPALSAAFDVINKAFDRLFPSLESITQFFSPLAKEAERFAELLEKNPRVVEALALAFESLLNTAITPIIEGIGSINEGLEKNPQGLIDSIVQLELRLRQAALTASGLVKIITAPARFGGILSGEARSQVAAGLKDIGSAATAKPLEVPVSIEPKTEKVTALAGELTDKFTKAADTFGEKLVTAVKKASDAFKDAQTGFANAVNDAFSIATDQQRKQARSILEQQVQEAIRSGSVDPARVAQKYGISTPQPTMSLVSSQGPNGVTITQQPNPQAAFNQQLDLSRLRFPELQALASESRSLQSAQEQLETATNDLTTAIGNLASKSWEVSVNVVNEAGGASTVNTVNSFSQ
jgi:tape measure domain-containing protein